MPGFSSTLILARINSPAYSSASFSKTGPSTLHGPHQGAQKSTSTGTCCERSRTRVFKIFFVNFDGPLIHIILLGYLTRFERFELFERLERLFSDNRLAEVAHFGGCRTHRVNQRFIHLIVARAALPRFTQMQFGAVFMADGDADSEEHQLGGFRIEDPSLYFTLKNSASVAILSPPCRELFFE